MHEEIKFLVALTVVSQTEKEICAMVYVDDLCKMIQS